MEAPAAARDAGATSLRSEYDEVEKDLLSLARGIENDELVAAQQQREALAQRFRALELKAIKEKTLATVRVRIDEAVREGADQLAPDTLAVARRELESTERYIAENRIRLSGGDRRGSHRQHGGAEPEPAPL
jgi:hypothetical protein